MDLSCRNLGNFWNLVVEFNENIVVEIGTIICCTPVVLVIKRKLFYKYWLSGCK